MIDQCMSRRARGSVRFTVAELGITLVVVMGHGSCGAVKAAMDVVDGNARFPRGIGEMIEPLSEGRLRIVGAYCDLDTRRVDFFDGV